MPSRFLFGHSSGHAQPSGVRCTIYMHMHSMCQHASCVARMTSLVQALLWYAEAVASGLEPLDSLTCGVRGIYTCVSTGDGCLQVAPCLLLDPNLIRSLGVSSSKGLLAPLTTQPASMRSPCLALARVRYWYTYLMKEAAAAQD